MASDWNQHEDRRMGEISEERFDERVESRKSRSSKTRGLSSMDHHIKAAETERVRSRKHRPRSGKQLSDAIVSTVLPID